MERFDTLTGGLAAILGCLTAIFGGVGPVPTGLLARRPSQPATGGVAVLEVGIRCTAVAMLGRSVAVVRGQVATARRFVAGLGDVGVGVGVLVR